MAYTVISCALLLANYLMSGLLAHAKEDVLLSPEKVAHHIEADLVLDKQELERRLGPDGISTAIFPTSAQLMDQVEARYADLKSRGYLSADEEHWDALSRYKVDAAKELFLIAKKLSLLRREPMYRQNLAKERALLDRVIAVGLETRVMAHARLLTTWKLQAELVTLPLQALLMYAMGRLGASLTTLSLGAFATLIAIHFPISEFFKRAQRRNASRELLKKIEFNLQLHSEKSLATDSAGIRELIELVRTQLPSEAEIAMFPEMKKYRVAVPETMYRIHDEKTAQGSGDATEILEGDAVPPVECLPKRLKMVLRGAAK